ARQRTCAAVSGQDRQRGTGVARPWLVKKLLVRLPTSHSGNARTQRLCLISSSVKLRGLGSERCRIETVSSKLMRGTAVAPGGCERSRGGQSPRLRRQRSLTRASRDRSRVLGGGTPATFPCGVEQRIRR